MKGEKKMFKIKLEGGKTMEVQESMYWHTTAHILAQAVKRLYPNYKLTIGPAIENGFYYDFDVEKPFTEEDIVKLEEEMKKIIKEDLIIERFELPREEAINLMEEKGELYKVELIRELPEGEVISFYKQGEFVELCRGPHLPSTGKVKAIKLTSMSSSYWKGDAKNKSLQRIYGISFPKASELEEYLTKLEEAKQRDHRKLGKELGIFMTHDLVGKGLPMYLPNGYIVWELLENYIKGKEKKIRIQTCINSTTSNSRPLQNVRALGPLQRCNVSKNASRRRRICTSPNELPTPHDDICKLYTFL